MNPRNLQIAAPLLLALSSAMHAATFVEVATEGNAIGTTYVFDGNASIGGGDFDTPLAGTTETGIFTRSWTLAAPGSTGIDVSVTGLAFGLPNASNTNGNVITATVTYLGADGVGGGADDVVLGSTKATLVYTIAFDGTLAGRYEWLFDSAVTGNIDGANKVFAVKLESLEADNAGSTFNMRFKTTSGTLATAVKMDVAGTSTTSGTITDLDSDGLNDAFETDTGIYVNPINTGTDPGNPDTDTDGLLDGQESNTGTFVSPTNTGSSPLDDDSDNDGLEDGVEANPAAIGYTATSPVNRDTDGDRLGDGVETNTTIFVNASDTGTDPKVANSDGDAFTDGLEVLFYGSNPNVLASFPGDGTTPDVGTFTPVLDAGVTSLVGADLTPTLGTAIINEAATGGDVDADFTGGVTSFVLNYPNAFPAAGSTVSITGFAWPVISAVNASGDILLQFFDPGADGVVDGIDTDTLVGTAKGTLTVTGSTTVMYWNFTPVNFTSSGTALMVKIQSSGNIRIKAQNQEIFGSGFWVRNDGVALFTNLRRSKFSIGGTAVAPGGDSLKFTSITGGPGSVLLNWVTSGSIDGVDLYRSTDLLNWGLPISVDDQDGTHTDTGAPAGESYYQAVPTGDPAP